VTAFSTSPDKEEEARKLGADHFINAKDAKQLDAAANSFDFILSTVNVELDWEKYIAALRPKGKLHLVGAAPKVESSVFSLIGKQASIGASPTGSPSTIFTMLEFAARHDIAPKTEVMPMSEINEAFEKLEKESPSHRIVLKNDF
jgi:alcohol/geraniol dehydrogenase (NADP+)